MNHLEEYLQIRNQFDKLHFLDWKKFRHDSLNAKRLVDLISSEKSYVAKCEIARSILQAYREGMGELRQREIDWRTDD
jgi:hypothetical protein